DQSGEMDDWTPRGLLGEAFGFGSGGGGVRERTNSRPPPLPPNPRSITDDGRGSYRGPPPPMDAPDDFFHDGHMTRPKLPPRPSSDYPNGTARLPSPKPTNKNTSDSS